MTAHVGTSGWSYDRWTDVLTPRGTAPVDRLAIYARQFGAVELNASVYRWPKDASFISWNNRLPPGFTMSVKAPRGLTHAKRLYSPEVWTERIEQCWHHLRNHRVVFWCSFRRVSRVTTRGWTTSCPDCRRRC